MDRLTALLAGGILISDFMVPGVLAGGILLIAFDIELEAIAVLPGEILDGLSHARSKNWI